jgi:signal transduction histidine kinase
MSQHRMASIYERVREKKESYRRYNFERLQEEAFATFFDLAQEHTTIDYLYQICVAVPREFFGLESRLYVIDPRTSRLERVCSSENGIIPVEERAHYDLPVAEASYETEEAWILPIRGNQALTKWIPYLDQRQILGLFEIYPKEKVDEKGHFFLEKFTNRIGYNLHQKLLIQHNINHIKFINQLVSDIEHNVISPNIYYRLFLLRLKKVIAGFNQIQGQIREFILFLRNGNKVLSKELCEIYHALNQNSEQLEEEARAFSRHYEHASLFLETLLRRDHFLKGTYVLRKQSCNFRSEIIQPLLERYLPLFEKRDIVVDNSLEEVPDEQVTLYVDKGLISQVFDNLFSNALKYAQSVEDQLGNQVKLVSYNRQILNDVFGQDIGGVRFNFFTTGQPLSESEARRVFEEGYRASAAGPERGTGHGLNFVRNVVEIHGGMVGCEPQRYGNLFYFVLPLKDRGTRNL